MEFKGTKGKWFIDKKKEHVNKFGSKVNVISSTHAQEICHVYNIDYNALLISKAPEILEMLKHLLTLKRCKDLDGKTPYYIEEMPKAWEKAEQLIKEATELK